MSTCQTSLDYLRTAQLLQKRSEELEALKDQVRRLNDKNSELLQDIETLKREREDLLQKVSLLEVKERKRCATPDGTTKHRATEQEDFSNTSNTPNKPSFVSRDGMRQSALHNRTSHGGKLNASRTSEMRTGTKKHYLTGVLHEQQTPLVESDTSNKQPEDMVHRETEKDYHGFSMNWAANDVPKMKQNKLNKKQFETTDRGTMTTMVLYTALFPESIEDESIRVEVPVKHLTTIRTHHKPANNGPSEQLQQETQTEESKSHEQTFREAQNYIIEHYEEATHNLLEQRKQLVSQLNTAINIKNDENNHSREETLQDILENIIQTSKCFVDVIERLNPQTYHRNQDKPIKAIPYVPQSNQTNPQLKQIYGYLAGLQHLTNIVKEITKKK
uniref:Uncharacterized protein TCIL3000_11_11970 n=1 Tax=Trypanosoma congolense (strain IL3000) TaxID=1068625 RepID=G0V233_TRYCI|nr:unnamed protein product [Trypanosoma congolense IL3000]